MMTINFLEIRNLQMFTTRNTCSQRSNSRDLKKTWKPTNMFVRSPCGQEYILPVWQTKTHESSVGPTCWDWKRHSPTQLKNGQDVLLDCRFTPHWSRHQSPAIWHRAYPVGRWKKNATDVENCYTFYAKRNGWCSNSQIYSAKLKIKIATTNQY